MGSCSGEKKVYTVRTYIIITSIDISIYIKNKTSIYISYLLLYTSIYISYIYYYFIPVYRYHIYTTTIYQYIHIKQ